MQNLRCWSAVVRTGLSGAGMSEAREGHPRHREPMASGEHGLHHQKDPGPEVTETWVGLHDFHITLVSWNHNGITGRTSSQHSPPNEPLLRPSISRLVTYASLRAPTSPRRHGDERSPMPNCPRFPGCRLSCGFHSYSTFMQFCRSVVCW